MNPFRARSSSNQNQPAPEPSGTGGQNTPPLQVNTRVPSTHKHVEFASPPAVPISPASYPSSPESTRQSPGHQFAQLQETSGYGQVIQNDPFQEEGLNDRDDWAIAEAARNARTNSEATLPTTAHQANVRDTLSRFASGGRRPHPQTKQEEKKPAMDVNAFTRLLLTGESGAASTGQSTTVQTGNDSSSSTDTSSTQPSTTDTTARTVEATPRSSSEHERSADSNIQNRETKRRPPPPKPRLSRGPENDESGTTGRARSGSVNNSDFQPPTVPPRAEEADEEMRPPSSSKKPPPPPLARRKSQKTVPSRPEMPRSGSSRFSVNSESDEPPSPATDLGTSKMAPPPPPPSRRPNSQYGRRPSMDLPATHEEEEESDSVSRPAMSGKRISQQSMVPPPVPPPRKNRASGRSSMESQHRPSMASLGLGGGGSARSSSEYARPGSGSRNVSNASAAADILADLEALQREVDAARASAGR